MKRVPVSRAALAVLVIAGAALCAFGCTKKLTVDPGFTPEGVLSANARLIVYQDLGNTVYATHEFPPNSGIFVLDSTFTVYNFGPGTVQGMVLDGTSASGYEVQRKSAGGGYAPIKDFWLTPAVKWLQSHWEVFPFHDSPDGGSVPPTYQCRGIVSGNVTLTAPLTNTAVLNASSVMDCMLLAPLGFETFPHDSLPTITWQSVAGAASYHIHVFKYRSDIRVGSEKFVYGIPAPVALGKVHDYYVAIVPPTTTTHKLGGPGAEVLVNNPMIGPDRFFFRISAVDASGRLIACTLGSAPDTVRIGAEAYLYSAGAQSVCIGCKK